MVHANTLGGAAARAAGRPVLWSLHHSDLQTGGVRRSTALLERANAVLSRLLADEVVLTSAAAAEHHRSRGYRGDRLVVIPNAAVPDDAVERRADGGLRRELGLPPDCLLVGRIGRLAPQKDWPTFLTAAGAVVAGRQDVHVIAAGRGVETGNARLVGWVAEAGLDGRCALLGERADAAALSAQLDVAVSSSAFGETTPLVLLEALGAGTPVVTTDVGDCAALVGPGGLVVPPRDPAALAAAVTRLLDDPHERERRGREGRRHVELRGGPARLVEDYVAVYRRIARPRS